MNLNDLTRRPLPPTALRLLAWLVLPVAVTPSALEAQACLGFGGNGFVSASGAQWREDSENTNGIGGRAGLDLGPLAATAQYLKFSGADEFDQEFDFEDSRATVALKLPMIPLLSLCPVVTVGTGGVLSANFSELPYKSELVYGAGMALGHRFSAAGSGFAIIPSAIISVENYEVDRLFDDILEGDREFSAILRGGVTVEIGKIYTRPYVALNTTDQSYLLAGALLGVTF